MVYAHETSEEEFDMHKGDQEDYPLGTDFADIEYILLEWDSGSIESLVEMMDVWSGMTGEHFEPTVPKATIDGVDYAVFELPQAWTVPTNLDRPTDGSGTDIEIQILGFDAEGFELAQLPYEEVDPGFWEKLLTGDGWFDPLGGPIDWLGEHALQPALDYYGSTIPGQIHGLYDDYVFEPVVEASGNIMLEALEMTTGLEIEDKAGKADLVAGWVARPGESIVGWSQADKVNQTLDLTLMFGGGPVGKALGKGKLLVAKIPGFTRLVTWGDDSYRTIRTLMGAKTYGTTYRSKLIGNVDRYPKGAPGGLGGQFATKGKVNPTLSSRLRPAHASAVGKAEAISATGFAHTPMGTTQTSMQSIALEQASDSLIPGLGALTSTAYRGVAARPDSTLQKLGMVKQLGSAVFGTGKYPTKTKVVTTFLKPSKVNRAQLVAISQTLRREKYHDNALINAGNPQPIEVTVSKKQPTSVEDTVTSTSDETASEEPVDNSVSSTIIEDDYYGKKKKSQEIWQF